MAERADDRLPDRLRAIARNLRDSVLGEYGYHLTVDEAADELERVTAAGHRPFVKVGGYIDASDQWRAAVTGQLIHLDPGAPPTAEIHNALADVVNALLDEHARVFDRLALLEEAVFGDEPPAYIVDTADLSTYSEETAP